MTLVLGQEFVERGQKSSRELWTVSIMGMEPVASSGIMINNIVVSHAGLSLAELPCLCQRCR
jgi:hypothetical protein